MFSTMLAEGLVTSIHAVRCVTHKNKRDEHTVNRTINYT